MSRPAKLALIVLSVCLAVGAGLVATEGNGAADDLAGVRAAVQKRFPTLAVGDFRSTPLAGVYQFTVGVDVFYTDREGRYVLRGDLMDFSADRNLSEERRNELRAAALAKMPESQMIVFGAKDAAHTITVFTDIDCGYCRRMHREIGELNSAGVRVRYLFYPRAGPGSESWQKALDVWCAKDRNLALTEAKAGRPVPRGDCDTAPPTLAAHQRVADGMRIDGTPMVLTEDGRIIGGYLPVVDLVRQIAMPARAPRG